MTRKQTEVCAVTSIKRQSYGPINPIPFAAVLFEELHVNFERGPDALYEWADACMEEIRETHNALLSEHETGNNG